MLISYIQKIAQRTPHKTALISPYGDYTYDQLHQAIRDDITRLRQRGMGAGDVVAILSLNHPMYVRLVIALWALRAIPLPLNTRLTADEIRYQLAFTQAKCLICADDLPVPDVDVAVYGFDSQLMYSKPTATRRIATKHIRKTRSIPIMQIRTIAPLVGFRKRARGFDPLAGQMHPPALIMFTSGTSGKPKGAMLTADNLITNAIATHERLSMTADDHWLCVLPLYHIGGLSIIIRCLMLGATVSLFSRFAVDAIHAALCTRDITLISLVPTMLYRLLERDVTRWRPTLRLILLGGAAADERLMRRCALYHLPIATTYGLTEASSQVCTATPDCTYHKPASVGKPMNGISLRIVDENGDTCPTGVIGEIAVRGKTVMAGYYRDPTATANALRDGELFTGDMGYIGADGDLYVVQRRSDLIVTGGENVYPAEVEAVLRQFVGVVEVVVVGIPDPEWGQVVGCALVGDVNISALQAYARGKLAGYKIPRRWQRLDALPLNSTGKVDMRAIRAILQEKA